MAHFKQKAKFGETLYDYFGVPYKAWRDLKPTGRWKIEVHSSGDCELYIEHKDGVFSKKWIHDSKIELIDLPNVFINSCKR